MNLLKVNLSVVAMASHIRFLENLKTTTRKVTSPPESRLGLFGVLRGLRKEKGELRETQRLRLDREDLSSFTTGRLRTRSSGRGFVRQPFNVLASLTDNAGPSSGSRGANRGGLLEVCASVSLA